MPPCCAKYPASAGSVTCALPPALLLHGAYLEPSFSSSNFNRIDFLNTGQSHITAQPKPLESTKRMNFTHLLQSLYEDNCKEVKMYQFWLWRKKPETETQGLLEKGLTDTDCAPGGTKKQQFFPTRAAIIHSPQPTVLEAMHTCVPLHCCFAKWCFLNREKFYSDYPYSVEHGSETPKLMGKTLVQRWKQYSMTKGNPL